MKNHSKEGKVVYFLSHPIQYFSPLLRELAKAMDLDVYYFSDSSLKGGKDKGFGQAIKWDIPLLEGYRSGFLKNYRPGHSPDNHLLDVLNPGVVSVVNKKQVAVVIVNGWTYSSTLLAIFWARVRRKEVWLRAESPLNQELKKSPRVLFLKKMFLKQLLFKFFVDRCLYIGTESRKFFEYYGVPSHRLTFTPYSVDNALFSGIFDQWEMRIPELKQKLGLPLDKKIILYSGKYIAKKRPLDLLKAFRQLNNRDYLLVMVGEGMLRAEMETYIRAEGLDESVILTGFVNQSEIPYYYAVADVFVMCSGPGETWGLSVNEAMNFAKPVIVSDTCGCSADLVRQGINGFIFQEGNIGELTNYLSVILAGNKDVSAMGKASREIINSFSIAVSVENLTDALAGGTATMNLKGVLR